jgi:hypothetical protein
VAVVVPPAGLEPATCALRRRLLCFWAYVTAKSELGDSICLYKGAANQHLPSALGGRWEWRVVVWAGQEPRAGRHNVALAPPRGMPAIMMAWLR